MVFSIFAAMKLGLIAPVVPFPSNKKLEKAILGHFHALSSNQASKPVWIWPSGLQTFLRSRVDSSLSLLPNESIACFNTIRCCTSNKAVLHQCQKKPASYTIYEHHTFQPTSQKWHAFQMITLWKIAGITWKHSPCPLHWSTLSTIGHPPKKPK